MRILSHPGELGPGPAPVCVAIGVFDGVHRGHQAVIHRMLDEARQRRGRGVVVTFDRHPRSLLTPATTPLLIQTHGQKLRTIAETGADAIWVIRFDLTFSQTPGLDFIQQMRSGFGSLASVVIGSDFHFGHKRSGNAAVLAAWGADLGFSAHPIPPVEWNGQPVSSTRVREAVLRGDFASAKEMLGRPYSLAGNVLQGDGVGRRLGFPTANLEFAGKAIPPRGVYAGVAMVGKHRLQAAVNIGMRPTLKQPAPALQIEAHLLDWEGDLYDQEIEIEFASKLRDEIAYPSIEALKAQIARDIAAARLASSP